jgi:hypothetical protein
MGRGQRDNEKPDAGRRRYINPSTAAAGSDRERANYIQNASFDTFVNLLP